MILAIDGTNWIHSLWHTVGDRAPRLAAERLKAVCDYCTDILACDAQHGQTFHPVVCCDRRSFRYDAHAEYKAGRAEKDPSLVKSLADGPAALSKDAVQCAVDGFEADDLLASFAAAAIASGQQAVLASADKDLYQCLQSGRVTILKNFKTERLNVDVVSHVRMYEAQWVTEAALQFSHGLKPSQWIDYQCLVGESGDNVPGCPGWGPKYAGELLQACGSILDAIQLLDRSSPKYNPHKLPGVKDVRKLPTRYRSLITWHDSGLYDWTRRLIALRTDIDVLDWLR